MTNAPLNSAKDAGPRFLLHWQVALDDCGDCGDGSGWQPSRRWSRQVVKAALAAPSTRIAGGRVLELTLRLCSNNAIHALNRDFRQQDKATNVLSFAAEAMPLHYGKRDDLGAVVLALPYLLDEAHRQGKTPRDHWAHLLVHGVLHLLGYDHIAPDDAVQMESLEQTILAKLGVADPYLETTFP